MSVVIDLLLLVEDVMSQPAVGLPTATTDRKSASFQPNEPQLTLAALHPPRTSA
jgi:hypothetical protein